MKRWILGIVFTFGLVVPLIATAADGDCDCCESCPGPDKCPCC
jgi:hypothetical protein